MVTRLLIDAAHPEETRVVVVDGTRLDAFDVESSARKQLKGNIYLAKVMRVEPSLQAAFVDFGGNRHGFLAFADIHPDYYQIPIEDRDALLKERAAEESARAKAEEEAFGSEPKASPDDEDSAVENDDAKEKGEDENGDGENGDDGDEDAVEAPESIGGDEVEEVSRPPVASRRYKIQEVIKRRQVLLIQVVKEERGTKGAALTTYLSLAGRYCVLMPNTARGGGVSRKISVASDRKRLRTVIESLDVPSGMGLIVRTAGQSRTKVDIRRDYDYLIRLWESVRELTLQSTAPTLVYEEGSLIKRAIRDLYSNDIPEVLVEGDQGYKAAKAIMKMLMPSHAKRVKQYTDRVPLFRRYQVEEQLDKMHSPSVQLKSGGTIVLNPTEALVAIDVNSGRSTRERSIEATALKTNLEASEEIARQLSLRDLAGLIVIDYIDMDQSRNNRSVERRLKDCLKADRARIQVGRISSFGLLELSRQRMRPSLLETSTEICPTCGGIGLVRSTESSALHVLRVIEEEGVRGPAAVTAIVPTKVAVFLLNQKRSALIDLELRFGLTVSVEPDPDLVTPHHRIERMDLPDAIAADVVVRTVEISDEPDLVAEPEVASRSADAEDETEGEDGSKPTKRRRRGKRGGRRRRRKEEPGEGLEAAGEANEDASTDANAEVRTDAGPVEPEPQSDDTVQATDEAPAPKRRAPRRRSRAKPVTTDSEATDQAPEEATAADAGDSTAEASAEDAPKPRRRRPRRRKSESEGETKVEAQSGAEAKSDGDGRSKSADGGGAAGSEPAAQIPADDSHLPVVREEFLPAVKPEQLPMVSENAEAEKPRRRGWWQMRK